MEEITKPSDDAGTGPSHSSLRLHRRTDFKKENVAMCSILVALGVISIQGGLPVMHLGGGFL